MLFRAHGVWNQVWMMMIVVVVSASASSDKEMVAHGKFAQQLRDHGDVFIFVVLTVLMFVVLGCMPPRRWSRWQRDLEEPLGPGENQNQLRSRIHAWFEVELLGRPRAEQQSGATSSSTSAAQGPVPQSSHDEDAACYEDWAEAVLVEDNGESQGYEGEHEQGDKDQETDQMPVNPDYSVYIVGEPHRQSAYLVWTELRGHFGQTQTGHFGQRSTGPAMDNAGQALQGMSQTDKDSLLQQLLKQTALLTQLV
ncbi:unnamed protein product, partial [Symbiodinium microadriaticum]